MHFDFGTALAVVAFVASLILVVQSAERLAPGIAVLVSGIMLLINLGVMRISLTTFRIGVVLPAILTVAGAICWGRAQSKTHVTAATTIVLVGLLQLAFALNVLR